MIGFGLLFKEENLVLEINKEFSVRFKKREVLEVKVMKYFLEGESD